MSSIGVFVVYDTSGRIRATAVPANGESRVASGFGMHIHRVEHPSLDRAEMSRYLLDLHHNHRIDLTDEPQLVRTKSQ